jgi:ATP-dependent Clp protease ATP-binding subunit ClpA
MAIANAVARASIGLGAPEKPMGSFLFYGGSGVGKTEVCKVLASLIFPGHDSLIRLDTSELSEDHAVSKLIGAPPGYTGYDEGGALTDQVKNRPFCLIVFDEIEKASVKVRNLLLQILDEGELTDSHGIRVSFKNTYIVMTSNVGYNDGFVSASGFIGSHTSDRGTRSRALSEAFSEEFLNRIDCIVEFTPLSKASLIEITKLHLEKLVARMATLNILLYISEEVADIIAEKSSDTGRGARKIRHNIISLIENPISAELSARIHFPSHISVSGEEKDIIISYGYEKATV